MADEIPHIVPQAGDTPSNIPGPVADEAGAEPSPYDRLVQGIEQQNGPFRPRDLQVALGFNEEEFGDLFMQARKAGLLVDPFQDENEQWVTQKTSENFQAAREQDIADIEAAREAALPPKGSLEREHWQMIHGKIEDWMANGEDPNFSAANFNGWKDASSKNITSDEAEKCLAYLASVGSIVKNPNPDVKGYKLSDELSETVASGGLFGELEAEAELEDDAAPTPLLSGDRWEELHRPEQPASAQQEAAVLDGDHWARLHQPDQASPPNNTPANPDTSQQLPVKAAEDKKDPNKTDPSKENEKDPNADKLGTALGHNEDEKAETAEEAAKKASKKKGGPNLLSRTLARPARAYDRIKNAVFGDPMDTEGKLHGDADIFRFVLGSHGIADMPHMRRKHVGTHTADKLVLYRPNSKCKHVYYDGGMKGKLVGRCDDNDYRAFISTLGLKKATIKAKGNFDHQLFMKAHGMVGGVDVKTSVNFDRGRNKRLLELKVQQLRAAKLGPIPFPPHQETLPNTVKSSLLNPFGKLKAKGEGDDAVAAGSQAGSQKEAENPPPQTKHRGTKSYAELEKTKQKNRDKAKRGRVLSGIPRAKHKRPQKTPG